MERGVECLQFLQRILPRKNELIDARCPQRSFALARFAGEQHPIGAGGFQTLCGVFRVLGVVCVCARNDGDAGLGGAEGVDERVHTGVGVFGADAGDAAASQEIARPLRARAKLGKRAQVGEEDVR